MADFSNIYNEIDANVNANGQQKITGPVLNKTLKDMLQEVDSEKQDTLVAGQNITINGNVISATGGGGGQEYYAGDGLELSGNVFSVNPSDFAGNGLGEDANGNLQVIPNDIIGHGLTTEGDARIAVDPSGLAGQGLEVDGDGRLEVNPNVVQEKLQAGANIQISGNTISATDTTYGAGQGLQQNGNVFSVKAGSGLGFDANGNLINTGGGGSGATYSAGQGIDISQNNVISAKAGPGLLVDPSTNNIELDRSALNFLPLEGGQLQATTPGDDTTLTVMDGMNEDYVRLVAPETQGAPHVEIFENGSGDTKFYYDHLERGTQTTINYPTQSGTLALTSDIPYAPVYSGGNAIDIDASTNAISVKYGSGLFLDGSNYLEVDYNSIPGNIAGNGLQDDGNGHLEVDFNDVQGKLTAGQNITISGNVISAAGGSGATYSAGQGINIDQNNEISVKASDIAGPCMGTLTNGRLFVDTVQLATILPGDGLKTNGTRGEIDVDTSVIQEKLVAGNNIQINGNVISATGGSGSSYSAGNGIDITNNTISVDATDLDGAGLTTNQNGELVVDTNVIQGKLTAGSGISIQNNVISATGGSGGSLWTSGTGQDSLFAPGTGSDIDYVDPSDPSQGINNQSKSTGTRSIATGSFTHAIGSCSAAFGDNTYANGDNSFAIGSGSSASYGSFAAGYYTQANGSYSAAFGSSSYAVASNDFVSGENVQTSGMTGNETAFGKYNDTNNANGPYLFTIGDGELQEIYHEYGTASWEPNPDDPESTDSWTEYIEVRKNAVDIKTNGDVFIEDIGGYNGSNSSNAVRLQDVINSKQNQLTAGTGISIQGNVISATGGGGSGLWTSGTGTGSVMSPGAFQANGNNSVSAGDYTRSNGTSSIALGTSTTTTGLSSAAIGANSTAAGSYSVALGHGLGAVNTDETALGKFNNYIDTGTTAEKTFFTVGNGTSNNTKSNVLEIKQNNDIYVSGVGGFDGTNASSADTLQDVIAGKQDTLVAGSNITISGNVISATGGGGGSYTASHGIDIINDAISVDVSDLDGTGLIADHQRGILEVDFTTVQEKLTAGSGITISGNTISATGGGSGNYLPLTGGQLQANPSDAETLLDITAPDSTAAVSISADTIDSKLAISADKANAGISDGDTFRTVLSNTGEVQVAAKTVNPQDPTDIGETTYTLVLPQKNDTIATLSDIQSSSSYSAGTGINIDSNNVISNTAPDPGLWVAGSGTNSFRSSSASPMSNMAADSIAIGTNAIAGRISGAGVGSIAIGYGASAGQGFNGDYAVAIGSSLAGADYSYAMGNGLQVFGENAVALGSYNVAYSSGAGNSEQIKFAIGNGTGNGSRSDAFEIKQNGDAYLVGVGGFTGNNYASAQTLQYVINNAGGGGTSYTAGQAIDITNGAISVDYGSGLGLGTNGELQVEWSEGPTALAGSGLSANTQTGQLDVDFTSVQGKLTAGSGITISGNTISATGGGSGSCLWSSGTGQNSLVSPGAGASSQGSDASGIGAIVIGDESNANGDYSFAHGQGSMANGDYSAAFCNSNSTGDYSFAAGSGADAQADYSVALGGGIVVSDNSDPQNPIDALRGVAIGEGATVNGVCGLAFMGGTATGEYSVAVGNAANATEMYSTALTGSTASGNYSFAASSGIAHAHYSTAISGAEAFGEGAFASGQRNKAYGYGAAALGYMAQTYSQADGTDVSDPNAGEVALGRYNYSEQGIVFSVGCGSENPQDADNPNRQNAITIDSTGKIFLKGLGGYTGTSTSGCTDLVSFLNNL